MSTRIDAIIIGAGAAGLMCAIEAGKRNRSVLLLDHANKPGKKILMSGGGKCNFTNYHIDPDCYISHNPNFCKSALSRYTQWDFIHLVEKHKIKYHEKTLGQLFCDDKSKDIVNLLLKECEQKPIELSLQTSVISIGKSNIGFKIVTNKGNYECQSLVIASGGLSIPTMGASPFAYQIAEQFGIHVWPTRAGLVPLTLHIEDKNKYSPLTGISLDCIVATESKQFRENILFTHRGLSGPAILQISSYWQAGESININFLPTINVMASLKNLKLKKEEKILKNLLSGLLPKRFIETIIPNLILNKKPNSLSNMEILQVVNCLNHFQIKPNGTEGYRTAEVTLGGIDCDAISSKTMQANQTPGLYFIGEALDVTGWLGGYNFQWAWSSGWAAGQVI